MAIVRAVISNNQTRNVHAIALKESVQPKFIQLVSRWYAIVADERVRKTAQRVDVEAKLTSFPAEPMSSGRTIDEDKAT